MNRSLTVTEHSFVGDQGIFTYKLRISKRAKNIRLFINQDGELYLVIPFKLRKYEHAELIHSKQEWISKYLKPESKRKYHFLGDTLSLDPHIGLFNIHTEYRLKRRVLQIDIPSDEKAKLDDLYDSWLYVQAQDYIPNRTKEISDKNNFSPKKIMIKKLKTRWGSCSCNGSISFNFKLMMMKKSLIDYVIVHELCHLRELNHSKNFWKQVQNILPDYSVYRKELKQFSVLN